MSGEEKEEEEEEEEDGFRFFLRHEKEGDGADDDEYGVDGRTDRRARGKFFFAPRPNCKDRGHRSLTFFLPAAKQTGLVEADLSSSFFFIIRGLYSPTKVV